MNREQKITKLCRAVRAYRGASHGKDEQGKTIWNVPPQPSQRPRVLALLESLGIDSEEMVLIDGFQNFDEFRQWVETLR